MDDGYTPTTYPQPRFHIFTYTDAGVIKSHYRVDHWPEIQNLLGLLRGCPSKVFDIHLRPLGKHQRV